MLEIFDGANWSVIAPVMLASLMLFLLAFIDLIRQPQPNGTKVIWGIVIVFVHILGPVLYFLFGRGKKKEKTG
ncbi:phospholipase D-like protein [Salsuginibacillus halophilus]|uniref:Phospholipase D-like protein n=1 Tax=Salsuginibacillus halophilus TaxID=517424 RepID=A0A2P8HG53_9BACI|nr:PLD nuclease N-terminal domain-containing protein [Salsuginibacillus halophilus]PSL45201.1 phospholipase D-like protein [Salsuginibacillus halophilus]